MKLTLEGARPLVQELVVGVMIQSQHSEVRTTIREKQEGLGCNDAVRAVNVDYLEIRTSFCDSDNAGCESSRWQPESGDLGLEVTNDEPTQLATVFRQESQCGVVQLSWSEVKF